MINNDAEIAEGLKAISADYSPTIADHNLFCTTGSSAHLTITLPAPLNNQGMKLFIKKVDSGNKTVIINANTNGSTIDGANTVTLTAQYAGVEIVCSGSSWYCVSDSRASKSGTGVTGTFDAAGANVLTFVNGVATSVA